MRSRRQDHLSVPYHLCHVRNWRDFSLERARNLILGPAKTEPIFEGKEGGTGASAQRRCAFRAEVLGTRERDEASTLICAHLVLSELLAQALRDGGMERPV